MGDLDLKQHEGVGHVTAVEATSASGIRASLDHPIIDADAHLVEYLPALISYLQAEGITSDDLHLTAWTISTPGSISRHVVGRLHSAPDHAHGLVGLPPVALDLATVTAPRLYRRRLDDFGIDFGVVYPSLALGYVDI